MHCVNDHSSITAQPYSPIYAIKPDKEHWNPNKTACLPPNCKHQSAHETVDVFRCEQSTTRNK